MTAVRENGSDSYYVRLYSNHQSFDFHASIQAIQNISASLKSSGILVATVPNGVKDYNPKREEGQKFGAAVNLESDTNLYDGRRLRVEFFENGEMVGSSQVTFFFNETYEQILREAGFRKSCLCNQISTYKQQQNMQFCPSYHILF
ncbi:hypothetical protein OESDEN_01282 [Oesophagostomum dentatum]|uniref:Uncharacterized protein n=1 Tax=Oesophagostomum dentatum TaxID=61180 RepID=A0A0B1TMH1_OESDE|nr:hypothetical protein OESDEN_01282 [Oesophagostomum dentatum]